MLRLLQIATADSQIQVEGGLVRRAGFFQLLCRCIPVLVAIVEFSQFYPGYFPVALQPLLVFNRSGLCQLLLEQSRSLALQTEGEADTTANQVGIIRVQGDAAALFGHHQGAQRVECVALKIVIQRGAVTHVLRLLEFLPATGLFGARSRTSRFLRAQGTGRCQ